MNPVAAEGDRGEVGPEGERDDGQLSRPARRPAGAFRGDHQIAPRCANGEPGQRADQTLPQRGRDPVARARSLASDEGDREHHDRGRDPVIEPALGVEQSTDPDGHPCVGDDRLAEGSVGGGKCRPEQEQDAERKIREQEAGSQGPEDDREQETDRQQPDHEGRFVA